MGLRMRKVGRKVNIRGKDMEQKKKASVRNTRVPHSSVIDWPSERSAVLLRTIVTSRVTPNELMLQHRLAEFVGTYPDLVVTTCSLAVRSVLHSSLRFLTHVVFRGEVVILTPNLEEQWPSMGDPTRGVHPRQIVLQRIRAREPPHRVNILPRGRELDE
jgi:hypothetical protein